MDSARQQLHGEQLCQFAPQAPTYILWMYTGKASEVWCTGRLVSTHIQQRIVLVKELMGGAASGQRWWQETKKESREK